MSRLTLKIALALLLGLALGGMPALVAPAAAQEGEDAPLTPDQAKQALDEALKEAAYPEADGKLAKQLLDKLLNAKVDPEASLEFVFVGLETKIVDHLDKLVSGEAAKGTTGKALEDKVRADATFKKKYEELGGGGN